MATFGKDYQSEKIVSVNDKTLAGDGFNVYMVTIQQGVLTSQQGRRFCVAGAASLPDVGDLWDAFRVGKTLQESDVDAFVEALRRVGYVQIDQTLGLGLNY